MDMSHQAGADVSEMQARSSVVDADAGLRTGPPPLTLQSAVRLLSKASRAIWSNQNEAHQCIVKVAALLQSEAELRETGRETASEANRGRLAPWQMKRVLRFIEEKLGESIGVPDLAEITRLSRSHFARAFRATIGEAPHAYLIRRRIERAQELILLTDRPLAQIALDCGLADQPHMTRLFRRVVGMSPGAWRRRHGTAARDLLSSMPSGRPSPGDDAETRFRLHAAA